MSIYYVFTRNGILVASEGSASQAAVQNIEQSLVTGEATGVIVRTANDMAPAYEFYDNLNDMVDIQRAWRSNNWNAFTRDLVAMTLGAMTAVLAAPAGPAWSVTADVAMSEAC